MITHMDHIQLKTCALAIRQCHDTLHLTDSNDKCTGEKDKDLIKRIGVKMKHASTLEHLTFVFTCNREAVTSFFKYNNFSTVTRLTYIHMISTNMRVIIENRDKITKDVLEQVVPEPYKYLLED